MLLSKKITIYVDGKEVAETKCISAITISYEAIRRLVLTLIDDDMDDHDCEYEAHDGLTVYKFKTDSGKKIGIYYYYDR